MAPRASAAAPKASTRASAIRSSSSRSKASATKREAEGEEADDAEAEAAASASAPEEARAVGADKENAAAVAAVPATPAARAKAMLPCPSLVPSPSPSRLPLQPSNCHPIPSTPAPTARRVACTPSAAACSPPPLPPRPTLSSDVRSADLLTALEVVFKKVEAVATGFVATHGPPLDVTPLYAELAVATSAQALSVVCHKLSLYLMREWKLIPAQQLQTLSAQYMRKFKILPHVTAEMEFWVVTYQAKAISVCQSAAVAGLMDTCRSACDKLILDCESQAAHPAADVMQRFSFRRTVLWAHFEMLHMLVQRALTVIQAGQTQLAHPLIATARQDVSLFLSKLSSLLQTPVSVSQQRQLSDATRKLVDDLMLLISVATLMSHAGDAAWAELIHSLLETEFRQCVTICNDTQLDRWRIAKLLQQPSTAQASDRRSKGIAELLQSLPVTHGAASPSSKSPQSSLSCLSPLGVLMSLYEQAFLTPLLVPAPVAADALRSSLLSAIGRVNADPASNEEDKRYAHGLYFLALACLTAATVAASAASQNSPLHASFRHSYQSLKHFRGLMLRTTAEMANPATCSPSSAPPNPPFRRPWPLLLDYTRCLYFRAVLAEHQGLHAIAQSLLENTVSTLDQVLYQPMQRSTSAVSSAAVPFDSLVVGKMHRARIHSKLDRWDAVQELLTWSQISNADSASYVGACGAPFLGPYAVHARQVLHWLQRAGSSESGLSDQLQRMAIQESKASDPVESCAQCSAHLSISAPPLPLVPCCVDTLMDRLSCPSVSRSFLESVLVSHALWRPPPLMRLVHHAMARLLMDASDHAGAAFHMHEAMAITARHEAWDLREGTKEGDNAAAGTAIQITAFAQERKIYEEAFVEAMPADWTVCSIDLDSSECLLLSRLRCDSVETIRLAAGPLLSISAAFALSLCRGNEASALAKDYNATVKPALLNRPDGKKPPAKELSHAKSMVISIESNRTAADNGISQCCADLERFLGDHVEMMRGFSGGPVILVLGPSVCSLPWENLPTLQSQCMTRMTAWSFIVALRAQNQAAAAASSLLPAVDSSGGYFVLNPQSNLSTAESHLRSVLTANVTWRGSCGTPDVAAWSQALHHRSYFTYVGHNGGEEFVPAKTIRAMIKPTAASGTRSNDKTDSERGNSARSSASSSPSPPPVCPSAGVSSVCLQIGCSSALQHVVKSGPRPVYDSDGLSLAYQIAGCPAMFGCLWNVTDDIDQWTTHIITRIHENKDRPAEGEKVAAAAEPESTKKKPATKKTTKNPSVVTAAAAIPASESLQSLALAARSACKYAHLNGASIICYGLPISS